MIKSIFETPEKLVISAVKGNAGAGGVGLALASDIVIAREGSVLNMHYKNMGLFGSEYHTYSLPKRIGRSKSDMILNQALPMIGVEAKEIGMIDHAISNERNKFDENVDKIAKNYLSNNFERFLENKRIARKEDELKKPLESYREEELNKMLGNIFQNNQGYREKRKAFVLKTPPDQKSMNFSICHNPIQPINNIIDGREIAKSLLAEVKDEVDYLFSKYGMRPQLAIIRVGNDPASISYIREKIKACENVGIETQDYIFSLEECNKLPNLIESLNKNKKITGIIIQLPLPSDIQQENLEQLISVDKDVDGLHWTNFGGSAKGSDNCFISCTPKGILCVLKRFGGDLNGKHVVIVGKSNIVGKPLANLILNETAATVTICHKQTNDLKNYTKEADILIVAAGVPNLIIDDMVKESAIVIDVGINRIDDPSKKTGYKLVGDVDFESVRHKAKFITPVPGGIGPLTVASLVTNTLQAFIIQNKDKTLSHLSTPS